MKHTGIKILGLAQLTDHHHLKLVQARYQDMNGREKSWIYATRGNEKKPDAVVVAALHNEMQKLVLIREFRVPIQDYQYGFPAGLIDPGESPEQAGARELMEETGLRMTTVLGQSPPVFSSTGLTDESVCMLYAECEGTPSTRMNEGSEEIEVVLAGPKEARQLLLNADAAFDVKTWIVLERFAATGRVIGQASGNGMT